MHLNLQGTLALIKPDAFQRRIEIEEIILKEGEIINQTILKGEIYQRVETDQNGHDQIFSWGFRLVDKKRLRFTRELAEEFYQEHEDKSFFRLNRVEFM